MGLCCGSLVSLRFEGKLLLNNRRRIYFYTVFSLSVQHNNFNALGLRLPNFFMALFVVGNGYRIECHQQIGIKNNS